MSIHESILACRPDQVRRTGTWVTLRQQYIIPEAFLLVFRVAGPRVELPEVLTHDGRELYSVLVDISSERGSREKRQAVTFSDGELLPRGGSSP